MQRGLVPVICIRSSASFAVFCHYFYENGNDKEIWISGFLQEEMHSNALEKGFLTFQSTNIHPSKDAK